MARITEDKIIEIFCVIDEFTKNMVSELDKNMKLEAMPQGKRFRNRKGQMSESEIMTILLMFNFGTFRTFKDFYLCGIKGLWRHDFPNAVSYNRFVELMPGLFFQLILFMKTTGFGKCSGISFVDATEIPICHNMRRYCNKVFKGPATNGKGTMGWWHGFKLHFLCNDSGEIITFCLTEANVDERNPKVWSVFTKELYGKVFADRGYISQRLFENLFLDGIHLVHGIWDKIMLRRRYIIETINNLLKNEAQIVHTGHRFVQNFIMNICGALAAYCFFDNKPEALPVHVQESNQLMLF